MLQFWKTHVVVNDWWLTCSTLHTANWTRAHPRTMVSNGPVSRASQQCRCSYLSISEARRVCTGPIAVDLRAARLYLHPTRLVFLSRHSTGAGYWAKRFTLGDRLPEELGAGTPATEVEVHLSARSRPPLRCARPCAALKSVFPGPQVPKAMGCSHQCHNTGIRM